MTDPISTRLENSIPKIMDAWAVRAYKEVKSAHHQEDLALKNSLPEYLKLLADALSKTIVRTKKRIVADKVESTRAGQKHGRSRATSKNYTMEQLIMEYQILRQVVCEELEKKAPLSTLEREVIVGSIEQAVNDAASEFSHSMRRLQEQITHTLAHDLRTPVMVARAASELIMRKPDNDNFHYEKAKQVCSSMDRVEKMISELLDVSRIEAGEGIHHEFKECNLDEIIREIAEEYNVAKEGKIVVHSNGSCLGSWYEDGLRRVIENLVGNAIKYGLEDSIVSISLTQNKKSASVTVHNDGKPIPEEDRKILFQQFKRSKSAEGKVGWGIGLSLVQSMVEAHGGNVEVQSDADNGTSFVINLPKTQPEEAESDSDSDSKNSKGPRDATVNH